MRYFGGKARVGQGIADYINSIRKPGQPYWEPFVGGAWIMCRVKPIGLRIGSDICQPLIALYLKLQEGWEPPLYVSEEDYRQARLGLCEPHLQAFIGFGCSFAGKWFGGFARGGHGADAPTAGRSLRAKMDAAAASGSLLKKSFGMVGVQFQHADYRAAPIEPKGWLIYCDPPYAGTTGYSAAPPYNPAQFWDQCDLWASQGNTVLVSEYKAPEHWKCVLEIPTKTDIRNGNGELEPRMERLFASADLC